MYQGQPVFSHGETSPRVESTVIRVGNVHPQATESDISALLASYGTVTKVSKVVTLSDHGPHAVANVTFSSPSEAREIAEQLNGKLLYPGMSQEVVANVVPTPRQSEQMDSAVSQLQSLLQQHHISGSHSIGRDGDRTSGQSSQRLQDEQGRAASLGAPSFAPGSVHQPEGTSQSAHGSQHQHQASQETSLQADSIAFGGGNSGSSHQLHSMRQPQQHQDALTSEAHAAHLLPHEQHQMAQQLQAQKLSSIAGMMPPGMDAHVQHGQPAHMQQQQQHPQHQGQGQGQLPIAELSQHLQTLQAQLSHTALPVLGGVGGGAPPGVHPGRMQSPAYGSMPGTMGGGMMAHASPYLRDGVPATAQEVVQAITAYMSQPTTAKPPAGCAPDAIKLFVGNIPKRCTEAVLHKVFQCYGLVVEIAVTRNRHSAESKGSAFVWYSTCLEAARAILSLHSRYAFPDAKGEHVRLVTVRPAVKSARQRPPPFGGPGGRGRGPGGLPPLGAPMYGARGGYGQGGARGSALMGRYDSGGGGGGGGGWGHSQLLPSQVPQLEMRYMPQDSSSQLQAPPQAYGADMAAAGGLAPFGHLSADMQPLAMMSQQQLQQQLLQPPPQRQQAFLGQQEGSVQPGSQMQ